MLSTIISKIGLPVLISVLSESLMRMDSPVTRGAADALRQVDEAIKSGLLSDRDVTEANRHAEAIARLKSEEYRDILKEINKSLRAEIASQDKYVRRMRPTFGYFMAVTWAAQMLGVAYIMVFDTTKIGIVLNGMASLSAIWAVGLSVLGIYVYKRSEDKKLGSPPEVIFWNEEK